MTFKEWSDWFEENKTQDDVKGFIETLTPAISEKAVVEYLESDGRPILDRYINKAVRSHDEKQKPEIDRMISEAVETAKKDSTLSNAEKTQKRIDELEAKLKQRDTDLARRDLISKLRSKADEMHIPLDLAVDLENPNLTEEKALERMDAYQKRHKEQIDAEVNSRLVTTAHKPQSGTGNGSAVDLKKMSFEDLVAMEEKGDLNARMTQ